METIVKHKKMERQKAHALVERLLTDSMETRRGMEELLRTNPAVQRIAEELREHRDKK